MKEFLDTLTPDNMHNFDEYYYNRVKCYLRRDIYEHVLKSHSDKKKYFDLFAFNKKWEFVEEIFNKMVNEVMEELTTLGWNTSTSFRRAGLFIYTGDIPENCFPDDDTF